MYWHHLTSLKFDELDRDTPVIIPLGSCEQHGRHLPLHVDTLQVEAIVAAVETRLSDRALFLPPLWLGSSHHHLDYPGTLSVRPSLYAEIIQDLARSVLRAGFRRIFFLNGHGGNELPGQTGLSELVACSDQADGASIAFASWWKLADSELSCEGPEGKLPRITHACEIETSLMLAIRPDLVAMDVLRATQPKLVSPHWHSEQGGRVAVFHRFHRLTEDGHMGNPAVSSVSKGQIILEAVTEKVVEFIEDYADWPKLDISSPPSGGKS